MAKSLKEMKAALLERTKKNYDRREPELGARYFKKDKIGDVKFWRAAPTKGNPHTIDIIPFEAGDNFPTQSGVEEGEAVYCIDLWVHSYVGPSKTAAVICLAKNYGLPCPVCDEVDEMIKDGAEWNDIPFTPKRRVIYNIVVMDDAKTEAQGVQIWDVSYKYMEEPILGISKSPRTGGIVAFAVPDKASGRSIVFDVGNDTYKKITGHRFEERDYDISQDILDKAVKLDQVISVLSEDEINKILYGSSKKDSQKGEKDSDSNDVSDYDESGVEEENNDDTEKELEEAPPVKKGLKSKKEKSKNECPYGGEFGVNFDEYQECDDCECKQECAEAKDLIQIEKEKAEAAEKKPAKRTLLKRR